MGHAATFGHGIAGAPWGAGASRNVDAGSSSHGATTGASPTRPVPGYHYGNLSNPIAPSGSCFGIWPPGGQEYYANGCYGHDEPGIQFYSTLPGSGGNVTWNVTLPIGRNSSATQSDLYTAIWFGMTLSDPY
ncbi:MAG TPA: hypothetical protein VFG07_01275, partial [Thermoplasmata archaeon]|nr:hypothetical protein [Thermoplasmata archaeon]